MAINTFTSNDSYLHDLFDGYGEKKIQFLSIEELDSSGEATTDITKFHLTIALSSTQYEHERTSGTLLGWLSDVGGLNDAILLIIGPIAGYASGLSFNLSLTNGIPALFQYPSDLP